MSTVSGCSLPSCEEVAYMLTKNCGARYPLQFRGHKLQLSDRNKTSRCKTIEEQGSTLLHHYNSKINVVYHDHSKNKPLPTTSLQQGSLYYQPEEYIMTGESLKPTIDLHSLIHPQKKQVGFSDPELNHLCNPGLFLTCSLSLNLHRIFVRRPRKMVLGQNLQIPSKVDLDICNTSKCNCIHKIYIFIYT